MKNVMKNVIKNSYIDYTSKLTIVQCQAKRNNDIRGGGTDSDKPKTDERRRKRKTKLDRKRKNSSYKKGKSLICSTLVTILHITNGSPLSPLVHSWRFDHQWTINVANHNCRTMIVICRHCHH